MSEINKGLDECLEYISRMSKGERMQMCIPAQNSDWDLVMFKAIRAAQARITELEALSLQGRVGLMTAEEWAATTPEARHRMNVYVQNAESLAGLICIMYNAPSQDVLPPDVDKEVYRLAYNLAPETTQVFTLEDSPAQTGEATQARFVRDGDE